MINVQQAKKFCCEDISLIENYNEAVASDEKWDVHHKLGLYFKKQWLIDNGFYFDQRAEMLVFMKHDEHRRLHHAGNRYRLGQRPSVETKRKMSAMHINHPSLSKPVSQFTKNGQHVATYPSAHEAERQTGVDFSTISDCCRGRFKSAGGFIWKLA